MLTYLISKINAEETLEAPVWPGARSCNALPGGGVFLAHLRPCFYNCGAKPRLVVASKSGDLFMFVVQSVQQLHM